MPKNGKAPHSDRLGDGPIEDELRDFMNQLAVSLDKALNGNVEPKRNAFVLMVFPFGYKSGRRCNYISSARREDVIVLFKEQLKRFEGWSESEGTA